MEYMSRVGKAPQKYDLEDIQDKNASLSVIGCLIKNPSLLAMSNLSSNDFVGDLHQMIFVAIYALIRDGGVAKLDVDIIEDHIREYKVKYEIYSDHNGRDLIKKAILISDEENFASYKQVVKKWSMLRSLYINGYDISYYYNPNGLGDEEEVARDHFVSDSIEKMIAYFQTKLLKATSTYNESSESYFFTAGNKEGKDLIHSWKEAPSWGLNYASQFLNTVTYGIKPNKLSILSAGTGSGKTRMTIANMCRSFAPEFYDPVEKKWVKNALQAPHGSVLYIGTEMDTKQEIYPMILAYLSCVDTDHIITGTYEGDEEQRVFKAYDILYAAEHGKSSIRLCMDYISNFTYSELETRIKKYFVEYDTRVVFFDYIHITDGLMSEYKSIAGGAFQRDDQALLWLSSKLKDLATRLNISIDSCTQTNSSLKDSGIKDERTVRGAKSIPDKADIAMVMSIPTQKELDKINPIVLANIGMEKPNRVISIYKNRGGRNNNIMIWLKFDLATLRVHDLFVTDMEYVPFTLDGTNICTTVDGDVTAEKKNTEVIVPLTKKGKLAQTATEKSVNMDPEEAKKKAKEDFEKDLEYVNYADIPAEEFLDL